MTKFIAAFEDFFKSIYELFASVIGTIASVINTIITTILNFFSGIVNLFADVFKGVIDVVGGVGRFLLGKTTSSTCSPPRNSIGNNGKLTATGNRQHSGHRCHCCRIRHLYSPATRKARCASQENQLRWKSRRNLKYQNMDAPSGRRFGDGMGVAVSEAGARTWIHVGLNLETVFLGYLPPK